MDRRLLKIILCPACRDKLEFAGEADEKCLYSGEMRCTGCGLVYSVIEETPVRVAPGTNMDGAHPWAGREEQLAEWVPRNFERAQQEAPSPLMQDFVKAVCYRGAGHRCGQWSRWLLLRADDAGWQKRSPVGHERSGDTGNACPGKTVTSGKLIRLYIF